MSTIKEIIERVDSVKPNNYPEAMKLRWVSLLDGKVAAEIMLMDISEIRQFSYQYPNDMQREPLVQFPHDDLYDAWLEAMIDYEYGEYNRYQNSMQVYNARYGEYLRWFAERYEPAQGCSVNGIVPRPGQVSYYITAYGLATMRGYQGTLDEWLVSITAYGQAVETGFNGSMEEWIASLKGEKGDKGDKGDPFTALTVGSVEALEAGSEPIVTIAGTKEKPVLNFGIPGAADGLAFRGSTAQVDADDPKLAQGYYQIVSGAPLHGIEEGFMIHLQIIPEMAAAQLIASSDCSVIWLRSYWNGWKPFRQLGFGFGTEEQLPADPQNGQLFFVKV